MTAEQKAKISEMRNSGEGYKNIAETLGLPKSTVASFCQRKKATGAVSTSMVDATNTGGFETITGADAIIADSVATSNAADHSHKYLTPAIPDTPGICRNCGKPVESISGHRERKYCSDACRMSFWKNHKDLITKKSAKHYTCACCGKEFTAYGSKGRKYCSNQCYISKRFGQQD